MDTHTNISQKVYQETMSLVENDLGKLLSNFMFGISQIAQRMDNATVKLACEHVKEQFKKERESAARSKKRSSKRRV